MQQYVEEDGVQGDVQGASTEPVGVQGTRTEQSSGPEVRQGSGQAVGQGAVHAAGLGDNEVEIYEPSEESVEEYEEHFHSSEEMMKF